MDILRKIDKNLAIILIAYLFISFFMITKFPKVWIDTSWTCIAPYYLIKEGRLANPIITGEGHGLNEHLLAPHIAQRILLAGIYKIFGFGLIQSRGLSIIAGLIILIATYFFAINYYNKSIAIISIVLLATDNVFFVTSRTIRADIFVACFAAIAFFLFLHGIDTGSKKSFSFSGLLIGISFYTHPNSVLVFISMLIIFLIEYKTKLIKKENFWIFCLFAFIGFLPYGVYVIKEDFANNFMHFRAQLGRNADFGSRNFLNDVLYEYKRYSNYIYFPKRLLIFAVQIISIIFAIRTKEKMSRYLVLKILFFVIFLPLLNPGNRTSRYFIIFLPALCILVSKFFMMFIQMLREFHYKELIMRNNIKFLLAGLIIPLFFMNQVIGNAYILWKHKDNNYYYFIEEIKNAIPKGCRIWGSKSFWIGLRNYQYITQSSSFEEVKKFKPQYTIIYDSAIWGKESSTVGRKDETAEVYSDIRTKIELLSTNKGNFIKRINDKYYGDVEIYKIDWDK